MSKKICTKPRSSKKESKNSSDCKFVDLKDFKLSRRIVSVNGEELPLAIGDRLQIHDEDRTVKTVTNIQIYEDGRIGYMLEWFDPADSGFKTEWVTSTELAFLNRARKERRPINAFAEKD